MIYDLIIIGSGPAGLTASIYASRYRIKHLVIGSQLGGAMSLASSVENYPGFPKISGMELTKKMAEQAKGLGAEVKLTEVTKLTKLTKGSYFVETADGQKYQTKTLILATGTKRRKLGVPGEGKYLGRGVSYCPVCDAAFFKDKTVAVIGGSNAAAMGAVYLAEFGKKVYLIYRRRPLRAEPIWIERIEKTPQIKVIYETNVRQILGGPEFAKLKTQISNVKTTAQNSKVAAVELDNPYKGSNYLPVDGVFIEAGGVPGTELVKSLEVELDEKGFVEVSPDMATNVPGVFAAGDIANASGELQQIITACSEGAIAATSVYRWLTKRE